MDRRYNNRDFEHFLKQNADQYRMFPSEKVWEGIHHTLHTRRRWYGIGLALLLLSTATVTTIMLNNAGKKQQLADKAPVTKTNDKLTKQTASNTVIIAPQKPAVNNSVIQRPDKLQASLVADQQQLIAPAGAELEEQAGKLTLEVIPEINLKSAVANIQPLSVQKNTEILKKTSPALQTKKAMFKPNPPVASTQPENNTVIVDNIIERKEVKTENENSITTERKEYSPYTIESVVNSYKYKKSRKKLSWQIFITPTISYRKLKENKTFLEAARTTLGTPANYGYSFSDINNIVTHKPDIGLQLGFVTGYPVSKRLTITAGLQFNVSKYDIRAYSHTGEVATIALSNNAGGTNTVSTITNYRNIGGYKADWLHNMYISGSAPVGLELKLSENKKTTVGIAGTIQPTYILGNRAYLLSADFKNYAEVPSLTRKWNLNTGFEIYAGYSTGKLDWRIGPNVRYQVFSSFIDKYPIREHLFDFGLKLGLMLK
ncbi:MAG: hypothetical protein JNK98_06485 [Chitinophagaceae bacterium]|nr:hypothetical protein [Chitinophagaceae bacterium]